jgi:hypothetical protein
MVATPVYLQQLGLINMDPAYNEYLNMGSKGLLYVSGVVGALLIISFVAKAFMKRRRIEASLTM